MIGNEYLRELYRYPDRDAGMSQLLEFLKGKDKEFLQSLEEPIDLEKCSKDELDYLIMATALIDYSLQVNDLPVPSWIRDDRLRFHKPVFYASRLSDFERVRLLYTSPAPFKARNVYFDLAGISRV